MFQRLASVAASIAAAVTGTETPETRAAGIVSGPGARPETPVSFRWRLTPYGEGSGCSGTVDARDTRAAFRTVAREMSAANPRRFPCGFDGPAVRLGSGIRAEGPGYVADAYGPDGVCCGFVSIVRADGRPIRRKGARNGQA